MVKWSLPKRFSHIARNGNSLAGRRCKPSAREEHIGLGGSNPHLPLRKSTMTKKINTAQLNEIASRHEMGESLQKIAKELGICCTTTLIAHLRRHGFKVRAVGLGKAKELCIYINGVPRRFRSISEASRFFNVCSKTLKKRMAIGEIERVNLSRYRHHSTDCMPDALLTWRIRHGILDEDQLKLLRFRNYY